MTFLMNLQLFALMPPDKQGGVNPLLADDVPVGNEVSGGIAEVPLDEQDIAPPPPQNEQPPQVGQPPQGQELQQGQGQTDGVDIYEHLERMREDILSRLPQDEAPVEPEGPSSEELEQQNQAWMESFYEHPIQQIQELAEQIASEKIKPFMQEREQNQKMQKINQDIATFREQHPDMESFTQEMAKVFEVMPEIENTPHALEIAYKVAKGNKFDEVPKSLDDYLQDDGAIDSLLENDELSNKLVTKLMNRKKGAPPVLGTSGTKGAVPASEGRKIKSIKDATRAMMAQED